LPAFLNQANKAKQSEAKQYVSSINKGQQAYYAENTKFGSDIAILGLGLKTLTSNYAYTVGTTADGATTLGNPVATTASALKGYAGGVGLVTAGEAKTTQSILCQVSGPNVGNATAPTITNTTTELVCPANMEIVTK